MIGLKRGIVILVKHEDSWKELFQVEKDLLNSLLKDIVIDIQHVGSTSIPGLDAKPIIDILIGVKSLDCIPKIVEILESNGFMYRPQSGTNERVLFVKGGEDFRTHHIHVVEWNGKEWNNHTLFRDYLIKHVEVAKEYSILKKKLVEIYPNASEHNCKCRKPETGLLLRAKEEYGLELSRCIVIGDRWSDMMAAERVNMGKILVLTGAGNEALGKDRDKWLEIEPDYVANNVLEAVEWILEHSNINQSQEVIDNESSNYIS